jgi:carbonic anhydrase
MILRVLIIVLAASGFACSQSTENATHTDEAPAPAAHAQSPAAQNAGHDASPPHADGGAHWTYDDQAHWDEMSEDAKACGRGVRQSPIALVSSDLVDEPDLSPTYIASEGIYYNNGHTLQIDAAPGQLLGVGDEMFEFLQAHFHDPSEHQIDGETFAMEMHFVHKNANGALAVVGVMFREGATHPALARLWASIPASVGKEHAKTVRFDPNEFLPADRVHFQYDGSLTTPPCSEGVAWLVMRAPIEASSEQIAAVRGVIGENARRIQARNARMVTEGE